MPRPKKTAEEINAMREKILDVALAIVQEEGPEAITSRAIAKRLSVSHMSLFTYFENQAAILTALRVRMFSGWLTQHEKIEARASTEAIPSLIKELVDILVTYANENPGIYKMSWLTPEKANPLSKNRSSKFVALALFINLIKIGIERGDFEERDPLLAAHTVLGIINMPFVLYHTGRVVDALLRDRMADEIFPNVMGYLKGK
ncbi:MAG: TetR/AcrR family transcriptional regulator [Anaerolineae bacterium]|jgi:AcrR family transcriptional regulator|nr:TetR/AcrR family transcriptional regulator [Anaerolineae bacterium]MBT7189688.1 TetR/AcrR family transcriptional regulator [Anaerolineae bacterium]MBT7988258.1 TetR/AcrR family transcriptional regulator [Anaerolineae bacterium]